MSHTDNPPSSPSVHAPRVSAEDKIPLLQKIMFSAGMNTEYVATGLMTSVLWMPYFNIGMGISPMLLGVVLMILRAWDAISDPIVGNISDNARTRWGRRRPFMVVGAILTAVMYPLFWHMPGSLGALAQGAYLVGVGMLFFTSFTFWAMPYYGLQLELTPNYDERTRLASWMALFSKISSLVGGWVLALATSSLFTNPETGKGDILIGMKTIGWVIAGAILVFGLLPPLFVKERYYNARAAKQPGQPIWQSVKDSARNRPLWLLIGISFLLVFGTMSVATLQQYLNIYYVFDGDLSAASVIAGWRMTAVIVTGVLSIPVGAWLSERFDKKIMVIAVLCTGIIGVQLNYIFMRPDMPYLQLIPAVLESGAYSGMWLFLPSMKADTADYDELHTSRRREGSINSFYSWFIKLALTCAMGVGGFVLHISGFDAKIGSQPPEVISRMFGLYLSLPVVIWGMAIVCAWKYPLNRKVMAEIRGTLESRRGKL